MNLKHKAEITALARIGNKGGECHAFGRKGGVEVV
jgi:hypothetical protein